MNARPLLRATAGLILAALAVVLPAACARGGSTEEPEGPALFASADASLMTQCVSTECPPPWATCPGGEGACKTDTSRDVRNCGACANACPRPPAAHHATSLCAGGKCEIACKELYADCNQSPTDGCETPTSTDPKNCGFCGNACKEGDLCWRGACGCPSGYTACGDECKKLDSDVNNCGSCGTLCRAPTSTSDPAWSCGPGATPPNTAWTCASSACTQLCKPGFGDCNSAFCSDGCEINFLTDPSNCGACGQACDAGQTCSQGACLCPAGTTRCDDACVDVLVDATNCGACGQRCPGPRPSKSNGGSPACENGSCTYVCFPGFADCDDAVFNGCEANLASDQLHCGSCATRCNVGAGQPCVAGSCLTRECDAGVLN